MSKTQTLTVDGHTVIVTCAAQGERVTYRGRRGKKVTTRLGQEFTVALATGEVLGTVERRMVTRETRTEGRTYVNDRWESPGWRFYPQGGAVRGFECYSKSGGIETLVARCAPGLDARPPADQSGQED